MPVWVVVAAAVGVGLLVGLVNGLTTVLTGVPPFIVTLGTMMAVRGIALMLGEGKRHVGIPEGLCGDRRGLGSAREHRGWGGPGDGDRPGADPIWFPRLCHRRQCRGGPARGRAGETLPRDVLWDRRLAGRPGGRGSDGSVQLRYAETEAKAGNSRPSRRPSSAAPASSGAWAASAGP